MVGCGVNGNRIIPDRRLFCRQALAMRAIAKCHWSDANGPGSRRNGGAREQQRIGGDGGAGGGGEVAGVEEQGRGALPSGFE